MNHLMLDLETHGTAFNSVIIQIGAIFFNPEEEEFGEEFVINVDPQSGLDAGLVEDKATIAWWKTQNQEIYKAILADAVSLQEAIWKFTGFFKDNAYRNTRVWGNGATFDNVIISSAYAALGHKRPWHFKMDRDIRTVVDLSTEETEGKYFDTEYSHNALDDCKAQLNWFVPKYRQLVGVE